MKGKRKTSCCCCCRFCRWSFLLVARQPLSSLCRLTQALLLSFLPRLHSSWNAGAAVENQINWVRFASLSLSLFFASFLHLLSRWLLLLLLLEPCRWWWVLHCSDLGRVLLLSDLATLLLLEVVVAVATLGAISIISASAPDFPSSKTSLLSLSLSGSPNFCWNKWFQGVKWVHGWESKEGIVERMRTAKGSAVDAWGFFRNEWRQNPVFRGFDPKIIVSDHGTVTRMWFSYCSYLSKKCLFPSYIYRSFNDGQGANVLAPSHSALSLKLFSQFAFVGSLITPSNRLYLFLSLPLLFLRYLSIFSRILGEQLGRPAMFWSVP